MTPAMRNGDFSAVPTVLQDPLTRAGTPPNVTTSPYPGKSDSVQPLRQELAAPDEQVLPAAESARGNPALPLRNYQYLTKTPVDKNQFNQRIDFNESSKSQWFGRYSWTDELTVNPGLTLDGSTTVHPRQPVGGFQYRASSPPTKVNEARFGYNSLYNIIAPAVGRRGGCGCGDRRARSRSRTRIPGASRTSSSATI